ncbi:hypothetical protein PsAD2_01463 [Pseudovibrio axinellae]|uniref:Uncharacterized protein n=1 Tax=Pseudovibrio axinellae TaxID=989403 RepID=A0A161V6A6_9HYPH|nr:hypothetical protein [Pseudovibrio axinellae]KZL20420.1 hypothetical protein PsAD2_01463 [Pseudovibrio axinellae]SER77600.1 hypothetical protein SAMN05421798_12217 [Pseudovibrio axinellae]
MNASNGAASRRVYDHQADWSDGHYFSQYFSHDYQDDENLYDEEGLEEEGLEEEGSTDEDLVEEDFQLSRPSWGAVIAACLTCFVLGSFLFSGSDVSDLENRLSRLEGAVHLAASLTPTPLSATSLTAQPQSKLAVN